MFEQTLLQASEMSGKGWSILASCTGQFALLGIAMLAPLVFTEALPRPRLLEILTQPATPPPRAPVDPAPARKTPPSQLAGARLVEPAFVPPKAQILTDPAPIPSSFGDAVGVVGSTGNPGGQRNGVIESILDSLQTHVPPPPAVAKADAKPAAKLTRITVGGQVQEAKLIRRVMPVYPSLARQARVSGVARLEGIIGKDGTIEHLRVISGHPLLVGAAFDAVRQWVYKPTLLNGEPVEVVAPIDVNFILN